MITKEEFEEALREIAKMSLAYMEKGNHWATIRSYVQQLEAELFTARQAIFTEALSKEQAARAAWIARYAEYPPDSGKDASAKVLDNRGFEAWWQEYSKK